MKRTLSIFLAVVLTFALAIPAFAAEDGATDAEGKGSSSQTVTAEYVGNTEDKDVATVYYVTVDWNVTSTLKYSDGTTTYTWNTEDTKYVANTEEQGWTGTATVEITVTNKSNADITATATWANAEDITAECTFANDGKVTVESAAKDVEVADGAKGEAQTGTITATVATPAEGTISENNATVGTITVTIAPTPAAPETTD